MTEIGGQGQSRRSPTRRATGDAQKSYVSEESFLARNHPMPALNAEEYNARGLANHENGDYDLAMADFDKAIALDPTLAVAYSNRGMVHYDEGDHDRAVADYDTAIELDRDLAEPCYT